MAAGQGGLRFWARAAAQGMRTRRVCYKASGPARRRRACHARCRSSAGTAGTAGSDLHARAARISATSAVLHALHVQLGALHAAQRKEVEPLRVLTDVLLAQRFRKINGFDSHFSNDEEHYFLNKQYYV